MRKVTAKFITESLPAMAHGEHIQHRGAEYWMACEMDDAGKYDPTNGVIYWISADRKLSGCINGHEYARVINGEAFR